MSTLLTIELGGRIYPVEQVIAALEPLVAQRRSQRMKTVLKQRLTSVCLGLENVRHNHNAIACLRTAESLGVHDVVSVETPDGYPWPAEEEPLAQKITMYADRWIDLHQVQGADGLVTWARDREMRILGTSPHAKLSLEQVRVDEPTMVLFGNEGDGLRPETLAACDDVFRIPMYGFTESFNLSVTVGMTLSALSGDVRQRLDTKGLTGDMSLERQRHLQAKWYFQSVRRADLILKRLIGAQE